MITLIRVMAVLCAVAIIGYWFVVGAHTGWSQTAVPVNKIDPVTEVEFTEYQEGFVPGIDFLVGGVAAAAAILALSLVAPGRDKQ